MKELYHETKSKPIPGDRKRKGKGASETQGEHWGFMQQKMPELAKEGVQGGERMRLAAKAWKERTGNEGKSKASKASAEAKTRRGDDMDLVSWRHRTCALGDAHQLTKR